MSRFADEGTQPWKERSFSGQTRYEVVKTSAGVALHAYAANSASALYRPVEVDLDRTPCLSWRWRVAGIYGDNTAEQSKRGDDYPARIYVVFDTGAPWWHRRALNYVWSSHQGVGTEWPNAYTERAHMITASTGEPDNSGAWRHVSRNVVSDYRRAFGESPPRVEAVAVMTDADDLGTTGEAWYKDIVFHAAGDGCSRGAADPG